MWRHHLMGLVIGILPMVALGDSRVINIGESVPNLCFNNENDEKVCLDDFKDTLRVLIFNAGY